MRPRWETSPASYHTRLSQLPSSPPPLHRWPLRLFRSSRTVPVALALVCAVGSIWLFPASAPPAPPCPLTFHTSAPPSAAGSHAHIRPAALLCCRTSSSLALIRTGDPPASVRSVPPRWRPRFYGIPGPAISPLAAAPFRTCRYPAVSSSPSLRPAVTPPDGPARSSGPGTSASASFFQAEDGIRDTSVTGVQTCALPI